MSNRRRIFTAVVVATVVYWIIAIWVIYPTPSKIEKALAALLYVSAIFLTISYPGVDENLK